MATNYKAQKEAFVSNLTGGPISEIHAVTAVAPSALVLWSVLQSKHSFFVQFGLLATLVDFLLNVGAILLATTLYASDPYLLNGLLLAPALMLYALSPRSVPKKKAKPPVTNGGTTAQTSAINDLPVKSFLSTYRGCMIVVTCIGILAVDFRVFPRRFAKVENWGTSLMDLGVGSFVFSAGIVAARPILKEGLLGGSKGLGARLHGSIRHSLPLLILGLIRLYTVKGLDYAEHVTEYGVHWNFFFTLGFLPPFVALFQSAFQLIPSYAALAVLLGAVYQILLSFTSLQAFILTAPRNDLFSKNREGIFSYFGYLAIFLAGQATGMYLLPRQLPSTGLSSAFAQRRRLLMTLAWWSGFWTVLYLFATSYKYGLGLSVSRRVANLPYFLWIAAFNCVQISAFCGIETIFFPSAYQATDKVEEKESYTIATSKVLAAFNRNGLAIFLLANLMTGLINLTIPTLDIGVAASIGILMGYAAVLTAVALALDMYNISLKM